VKKTTGSSVLDAQLKRDPFRESTMIKQRRRFRQTTSLTERLRQFADKAQTAASRLPIGSERKQVMEKVALAERAIELEGWLDSRELQPPQR
jgi:hypothetical protein